MKKTLTAIAVFAASAGAAMAKGEGCDACGNCTATPVPEISALEGTAALVALAAIVLLTWERRRRAY